MSFWALSQSGNPYFSAAKQCAGSENPRSEAAAWRRVVLEEGSEGGGEVLCVARAAVVKGVDMIYWDEHKPDEEFRGVDGGVGSCLG